MRKLIYFLASLIILILALTFCNDSNNVNAFALNEESNNINTSALNKDKNNASAFGKNGNYTNYTSLDNLYYRIIDRIVKNIHLIVVPVVTILLFIINSHREKTKLKQFYTVRKYVKKLKHKDFKIPEYHDYYLKKDSHDEIINLIKNGNKKILIKGMSGLGKTRMVYEAIKELGAKDRYFVVSPLEKEVKLPIWVPKFIFNRKIFLVFDNLDKYVRNKIAIQGIISEFEKNSKDLIVIATCRDEEFEILDNIFYCPDPYLSKIVEDYPLGDQLFSDMLKLKELLNELQSYENLFKLGNAFYFKEKYQDAIACNENAIELKPDYAKAWYGVRPFQ